MSDNASFGSVSKEAFEFVVGGQVADSDWAYVANEIEGRVDNFIEELLQVLAVEYAEGVWVSNE
jgi:hypothetical protein